MSNISAKPRVLHLFSNHRWTGPAEPVLLLIKHLRDLGWDVEFACSVKGVQKDKYNRVLHTAKEWNIPTLDTFYLCKHRHPLKNMLDVRTLSRQLQNHPYSIIHTHMDNDHRIAGSANTSYKIPLIRSNHTGVGLPVSMSKWVSQTDYILEPSQRAHRSDMEQFHLPPKRCPIVPLAIDLDRFRPDRTLPDMRERLNIPAKATMIGIVARMQTHRKYHLLFQAFYSLLQEGWNIYLIVIGRGTRQEEVGFAPVRELKIEDRVIFTGYLDQDDYVSTLNLFDIAVYLQPGSDGTCRTVREFMAMGKPVIATNVGILPELIQNHREGLIINDTVEDLYHALRLLLEHPSLRQQLSLHALRKAQREFDPRNQAKVVSEIYESILTKYI